MLSYFTDGSAIPNPGRGGFAVIKNGKPYIIGGEPAKTTTAVNNTTNVRMEGMAILTALHDADGEPCEIMTDSEMWANALTEWAATWRANNWGRRGDIKNLDLVTLVYESFKKSRATISWTKGHAGTTLNELADIWANKAREYMLTDPVYAEHPDIKVNLDLGSTEQLGLPFEIN